MNGGNHRLFAAASWSAVAVVAEAPLWQVIAGIPVAVAFANAPDWDNTKPWKKLDKWLPDERLGGGGPLGHRQLLHWWGIPVLLALLAHRVDLGVMGWAVYAALVGFGSHILLDMPFGKEGMGTRKGVPVFLWFGRVGGWFYSDKFAAKALVWPICLGLCWVAVGLPGLPEPVRTFRVPGISWDSVLPRDLADVGGGPSRGCGHLRRGEAALERPDHEVLHCGRFDPHLLRTGIPGGGKFTQANQTGRQRRGDFALDRVRAYPISRNVCIQGAQFKAPGAVVILGFQPGRKRPSAVEDGGFANDDGVLRRFGGDSVHQPERFDDHAGCVLDPPRALAMAPLPGPGIHGDADV